MFGADSADTQLYIFSTLKALTSPDIKKHVLPSISVSFHIISPVNRLQSFSECLFLPGTPALGSLFDLLFCSDLPRRVSFLPIVT